MPRSVSSSLQGIIPALPTPLTERQEVDVEGLEKLLRHVLSGGVHGLWVLGSSGEFTAFSEEERKLIVEVCVKEAKGQVPVIVGLGDNDLRKVIRYAEMAHSVGADACFVLLPFYFSPDAQEALTYLRKVAQSAPLPIVLYDNPLATKVKLAPKTFAELSDQPNIIAIKDSGCDYIRFQELFVTLREKTSWKIFQGDERLVGSSLLWGADGAVTALASIAPELFVELYESAGKGDAARVLALQKRVLSLTKLFELKGESTDGAFFAGLKAALRVLGICGDTISVPFSSLPGDKMPEVEKLLRACQVI